MNFIDKYSSKKKYDYYTRVITLGEITEDSVNEVIQFIYEINEEDEKQKINSRPPIKIIINSSGGDINPGLGLIDVIENSKTPIQTICHGYAMSMGFFIFVSGHNRKISKRSTLMYHDIHMTMEGKMKDYEQEIKEARRLKTLMLNLVLLKTKIPVRKLYEIDNKKMEWYITPEEAIKYNMVDEIL